MASCSGNKSESQTSSQDSLRIEIDEFRNSLSSSDTTRVMQLCNECMTLLKDQKIDEALGMLYVTTNGDVQRLPAELLASQKSKFTMMPVLNYELESMNFATESNNDIKYCVYFDEEDKNAMTFFMFNPVKVGEDWYLTIKTADEAINLGNE